MSILARNATANLFNEVKVVSVVVAAGSATTSNTADTELIGGQIVGFYPSAGAADKSINLISLAPTTGVVTVTLSAASTAAITYNVVVRLHSGDIA